jgi:uncharacterized damage-inducible protein DinB
MAFAHHVWATLAVIDLCLDLDEDQLKSAVPGTFGPIIETLRHVVSADCAYLELFAEDVEAVDESTASLSEMRAAMARNGPAWQAVLEKDLDAEEVVVRSRDDGSQSHAPLGVRLSQVIHHGTDHRSQICTALTNLGVEPPPIDVWDYADSRGWLREIGPPG